MYIAVGSDARYATVAPAVFFSAVTLLPLVGSPAGLSTTRSPAVSPFKLESWPLWTVTERISEWRPPGNVAGEPGWTEYRIFVDRLKSSQRQRQCIQRCLTWGCQVCLQSPVWLHRRNTEHAILHQEMHAARPDVANF